MTLDRLLLARHGQTDWNVEHRLQGQRDVPLNDTGRGQIRALGERLAGEPIDAMVASDLARAAESARLLSARLGLPVRFDPAWREMGLGVFEGQLQADVAPQHADLISAAVRAAAPLAPGGESYPDIAARLQAGYDGLVAAHAGQTVLVVGHGGTLKALIALLIGLPPAHIERLSLAGNACLSELHFDRGYPQLIRLGDVTHLG